MDQLLISRQSKITPQLAASFHAKGTGIRETCTNGIINNVTKCFWSKPQKDRQLPPIEDSDTESLTDEMKTFKQQEMDSELVREFGEVVNAYPNEVLALMPPEAMTLVSVVAVLVGAILNGSASFDLIRRFCNALDKFSFASVKGSDFIFGSVWEINSQGEERRIANETQDQWTHASRYLLMLKYLLKEFEEEIPAINHTSEHLRIAFSRELRNAAMARIMSSGDSSRRILDPRQDYGIEFILS